MRATVLVTIRVNNLHNCISEITIFKLPINNQTIVIFYYSFSMHEVFLPITFVNYRFWTILLVLQRCSFIICLPKYGTLLWIWSKKDYSETRSFITEPGSIVEVTCVAIEKASFSLFFSFEHLPRKFNMESIHFFNRFIDILLTFFNKNFKNSRFKFSYIKGRNLLTLWNILN